MKVRVPIIGTVGKSVAFDPNAGARAEAAVAALAAQISAGLGGTISHSALQGLQVGDDHPQYTGNQFPETITGQWNFQTIPHIQGETLAEYIEDVVGGSFFDFLQDTTSVVWTYFDTAQQLEANVPPEFVQDLVGAMLTDSTSIDFTYNDPAGTFTATIIDEYVQDLVGAMLTDSTSIDFTYNDPAGTFTAVVLPAGVNHNALANLTVGDPHTQYALDTDLANYVPTTRTLTAGNGLTGGGDLSANRTFDVGAGTGILSNANDVAINFAVTATWTANHLWTDTHEVQLGTGSDLRISHDGVDSRIRNDTGELRIVMGATDAMRITQGGSFGFNCAPVGGGVIARFQDPGFNDAGFEVARGTATQVNFLGYDRNAGALCDLVFGARQIGVQNFANAIFTLKVFSADSTGNNSLVDFQTDGGTSRGSITYNRGAGLTVYNTTSDARLKKNIRPSGCSGDIIDAIKVRAFDWRDSGAHVEHWVVAQELAEAFPLAVTQGERWSVDPSKLVPLMVKELQDLRRRLKEMEQ